MITDCGSYPPYHVEDYAHCLSVIRDRFDKLCEFSFDEHEGVVSGSDERRRGKIDRDRDEIGRKLERWHSEVFSLIGELYILLFALQDGRETYDMFMAEIAAKRTVGGGIRKRARPT